MAAAYALSDPHACLNAPLGLQEAVALLAQRPEDIGAHSPFAGRFSSDIGRTASLLLRESLPVSCRGKAPVPAAGALFYGCNLAYGSSSISSKMPFSRSTHATGRRKREFDQSSPPRRF